MDAFRLDILPDAYELHSGAQLIARLDGGAAALIPGTAARLRELDIEHAIERSEDWLMPFSKSLQGSELMIRDATCRTVAALSGQTSMTVEDVEKVFTRAYDEVAFGRATDRVVVADLVLLRELAHHGRLARLRVEQ